MLDWAHKLTLRAVAQGDADESPALRTLVASGLVEQHPEGGYVVTAAGRVALEDDAKGGFMTFSEVSWGIAAAPFVALVILFAVVNTSRGDALLSETQIISLLMAGVVMSLVVAYAKRAAR